MHHTHIDSLACGDSVGHRLDSGVKLVGTVVFTVCVLSSGRTAVSILFCYAVWPFALLVMSGTPLRLVGKQILYVSPFIAVLAGTSLFYSRVPVSVEFGPVQWEVSEGVLRCCAIIGKFVVSMGALMWLATTTRFNDILIALEKFGVPRLLIVQLSFLWRYIFMLIDRATHMISARAGRSVGEIGFVNELKTSAAMIGALLVSSVSTAQRVNMAMLARGFDGHVHSYLEVDEKRGLTPLFGLTRNDAVFCAATIVYLAGMLVLAGIF